ncbi:adenylosuccinate lyase, partial [Candidatus Microgenomates bacterium]|nr:adenylosuccinate lyase [Candidatus Microgenomates bacterium]
MLNAISPLDGRYANVMAPLAAYFSEMSLFKHRLEVEIEYLLFLAELKVIRKMTSEEKKKLKSLIQNFSEKDFLDIKDEEKIVRHDVKALEYFIRKKIIKTSLSDLAEFIHFGLTSEDVNNLAISLSLSGFLYEQFLPQLNVLI